jgi:hypothetical protein
VIQQYVEEKPEYTQVSGHSTWYVNASKGKNLLNPDGTEREIPRFLFKDLVKNAEK